MCEAPILPSCLIHPRAWKGNSPKFVRKPLDWVDLFEPPRYARGECGLLLLRDPQHPRPFQHQRADLLLLVGHAGG